MERNDHGTGTPILTTRPNGARRYLAALGLTGLWFVTVVAAPHLAEGNALLMGLAVVTASAWSGGPGPGLLATFVTLLSSDYVLPAIRPLEPAPLDNLRPGLFASVAILVSALSQAKKHLEAGLERTLLTLERRVHERTEDLSAANAALNLQIAERKKAEDAYRELFENASDMVFTLALDGTFTSINKVGERLTGRSRAEIGRLRFEEVVAPRQRSGIPDVLHALRDDGVSAPMMLEIRGPRGETAKVEVTLRLILDDGAAAGVHGVGRDLTERERLESELRQAQKLEAIAHLAGGVAHDFNNILMVVQGYSELLLSPVEGHDQRADLHRIQEAARRGGDLTRQLLAFGRKQMLKVQPLDLNTVVLDSGQMLLRVLGDNITLHLHPEPRPCPVEADRIQLEQVLINLAANARDAMSRGGALTVSVGHVEIARGTHGLPGGAYVKLEVGDTGRGMDDATRQRVFEPFFTTKAPGKGSGLGLSTVYGVVKQLGGTVTVDSSPLKGSTFSVLLPLTAKVPATAGTAAPPELAASSGETVLLVEDDAAVRVLLSNVLRRHGYQVLVADEPRQALSLAARHTGVLDLVLTDVIMPGMSGPEMVAMLKAIRPEPAVLYLSGYAGDELVQDGVPPESLAFVQKPVSVPQLLQAVKQVLTQREGAPPHATTVVAGAA